MVKKGIAGGELFLQLLLQGRGVEGVSCVKRKGEVDEIGKVFSSLYRDDFQGQGMSPIDLPTPARAARTLSSCSSVWVAM